GSKETEAFDVRSSGGRPDRGEAPKYIAIGSRTATPSSVGVIQIRRGGGDMCVVYRSQGSSYALRLRAIGDPRPCERLARGGCLQKCSSVPPRGLKDIRPSLDSQSVEMTVTNLPRPS